ncbi:uncharacterized protein LOC110042093 [Orbicella faveolata]|uniref:uncharacterized protein LOC110042093 n=1 Tax=Orbicella faveolata TaxID=48498 RepID=UPI0009E4C2EF|nr:uncharacterized protein LOC110042093 [Orbicella faveolata]
MRFVKNMDKNPLFMAIIVMYLAPALHGKTATFKVQVKNDGGVFNEVVKINLGRKIEKFTVPSQDGSQAADIIHDFRKKLTMITFPEKQVCYLARLSGNLPNPLQLFLAIKKATVAGRNDSNVDRVKITMEVKGLFQYHTSLSEAMRKQCRSFPIYRIEPVEEVISITSISNHAGDEPDYSTYRNRRGPCSGSVCDREEECYPKQCGASICYECKEVKVCNQINC